MPSTWFPMSSCYLSPSQFCSLVSYSRELCNPTNTWACIYTQSCLYVLGDLWCKPLDALYLLILKKKRQNGLTQRMWSQPSWNVGNFRYKSELRSMKDGWEPEKSDPNALKLLSGEVFFRFEIGNLQPLLLLDIRRLRTVGLNSLQVMWISENIQNVQFGSKARRSVGNF